ncbi:DUF2892 domain-containing protein [uncultured Shimia sp.]|uniref:YgaP family membrane protein n=1 Tax=uncultured Shimia sp. TaxID=573152 RepID=UPI0026371369|nr:DUF2892 domain-containing protein [uncultured Shimia sp.]
MLSKNVGSVDRIARLALGILLILGAVMGYGAWMWIGVIPLATGLMSSCPIYSIFGIRTCPMPKD